MTLKGEMLITKQTATLLQLSCEVMFDSNIIFKSNIDKTRLYTERSKHECVNPSSDEAISVQSTREQRFLKTI